MAGDISGPAIFMVLYCYKGLIFYEFSDPFINIQFISNFGCFSVNNVDCIGLVLSVILCNAVIHSFNIIFWVKNISAGVLAVPSGRKTDVSRPSDSVQRATDYQEHLKPSRESIAGLLIPIRSILGDAEPENRVQKDRVSSAWRAVLAGKTAHDR